MNTTDKLKTLLNMKSNYLIDIKILLKTAAFNFQLESIITNSKKLK